VRPGALSHSEGSTASPWLFFLLVYVLAVPFWLLGYETRSVLLPGLPIAALMAVCPVLAAILLLYGKSGTPGVVGLLRRSFDYNQIPNKIWLLPAALLPPVIAMLSYVWMSWSGIPVPSPHFTLLKTILLFAIFFVAALGEELGWSGYATEPLQQRHGALAAGLIIGAVWAVIHYIPLMEAHRSLGWIAGWSIGTISTRIIMVWLFNNAGRSVLVVTLLHAMGNVAWQLFPINGSYFDPRINGLIMLFVAAIIVIFWRHNPVDDEQLHRRVRR
jgi:uncharacterized protein